MENQRPQILIIKSPVALLQRVRDALEPECDVHPVTSGRAAAQLMKVAPIDIVIVNEANAEVLATACDPNSHTRKVVVAESMSSGEAALIAGANTQLIKESLRAAPFKKELVAAISAARDITHESTITIEEIVLSTPEAAPPTQLMTPQPPTPRPQKPRPAPKAAAPLAPKSQRSQRPARKKTAPRTSGDAKFDRSQVVVLTRQAEFLDDVRRALGPGANVYDVGALDDLLNMGDRLPAAVLLIDAAYGIDAVREMGDRVDVAATPQCLLVAGRNDDRKRLAQVLQKGQYQAFLHKPLRPDVLAQEVEQGWRKIKRASDGELPSAGGTVTPTRSAAPQPPLVLIGGIAAGVLVIGVLGWFLLKDDAPAPVISTPIPVPTAAEPAATVTAVAPPTPDLENPVSSKLAAARAAFEAGRTTEPVGDSALDYYLQVVQLEARNQDAAAGLDSIAQLLLDDAEALLGADDIDGAVAKIDLVRQFRRNHEQLAQIDAALGAAVSQRALALAASGEIGAAERLLDQTTALNPSLATYLVTARDTLARVQGEDRIGSLIQAAVERVGAGNLIAPAGNNARGYLTLARQELGAAPAADNALVNRLNSANEILADALLTRADTALTAGDFSASARWLDAAADLGVRDNEVAALRNSLDQARDAAPQPDAAGAVESVDSAEAIDVSNAAATTGTPAAAIATPGIAAADPSSTDPVAQPGDTAEPAASGDAPAELPVADVPPTSQVVALAVDPPPDQDSTASGSAGVAGAGPVDVGTLRPVRYDPPEYPEAAMRRRINGSVQMEFTVDAEGRTRDIEIISAEPGRVFNRESQRAVRRWRFEPVTVDGRVVEQRVRVTLTYQLED